MRKVQSLQFSRIDTLATFDNLDTVANFDILDKLTILKKSSLFIIFDSFDNFDNAL